MFDHILSRFSIRDTVETQSFVSNTIKRYSRFRAKQERGAARREKRKNGDSARKLRPKKTERQKSERPKSLDYGKNIYANIQNPLDKKTLVATWIETSQKIVSKPEKIGKNFSRIFSEISFTLDQKLTFL